MIYYTLYDVSSISEFMLNEQINEYEFSLRSLQPLNYSRISEHDMEHVCSNIQYSQENSLGPYVKHDESGPYQPFFFL